MFRYILSGIEFHIITCSSTSSRDWNLGGWLVIERTYFVILRTYHFLFSEATVPLVSAKKEELQNYRELFLTNRNFYRGLDYLISFHEMSIRQALNHSFNSSTAPCSDFSRTVPDKKIYVGASVSQRIESGLD